jgi:adenylate cyclase
VKTVAETKYAGSFGKLTLIGVMSSVLIAAVLVWASRAGLVPDAPDQFSYDWRTALLSDTAPSTRDDIAVVLINDNSLTGYPYRSPIDRGLLAEVVRAVDAAGPKAMALDFIFDQPTEAAKDTALKEALKSARNHIVAGAIDQRSTGVPERNFKFQEAFLNGAGLNDANHKVGHVYFVNQKNQLAIADQTIRFIAGTSPGKPERAGMAQLLAEIDGKKPEPASSYIAWLRPPPTLGSPTFQTFRVRAHRDENGNSVKEPFPKSWQEAIKGKIVLIGGEITGADRHLTPFSVVDDSRMTGVFIHAQILAQLRDGRSIYLISLWQELLAVALVAGLGFIAAVRWALHRAEWLATAGALVFFIVIGLVLFAAFNFVLPSATLVLAWPAGLFAGNLCEGALASRGSLRSVFRRRHPEGV